MTINSLFIDDFRWISEELWELGDYTNYLNAYLNSLSRGWHAPSFRRRKKDYAYFEAGRWVLKSHDQSAGLTAELQIQGKVYKKAILRCSLIEDTPSPQEALTFLQLQIMVRHLVTAVFFNASARSPRIFWSIAARRENYRIARK